MAMPNNGYQYINKQVNNVKLVNNNNLTLNVRNFNNRINSINISGSNEDPTSINLKSTAKGATQPIPQGVGQVLKTQRYTRDNSLNKGPIETAMTGDLTNQSAQSANKSLNQQQVSQYYLNQQMKAVGIPNKSNSVSPIRVGSNGSDMKPSKGPSKSPLGRQTGQQLNQYDHPRNQSAMASMQGNDQSLTNQGIRGVNSSAMLGVNNSSMLGNASAQRQMNPGQQEFLNASNDGIGSANNKKISGQRGSLSHRSSNSNVSNSNKPSANQPQPSTSTQFSMSKQRTARGSSGHSAHQPASLSNDTNMF